MRRLSLAPVLACSLFVQVESGRSQAPSYSESGIVNAASNSPELAPNTLATLYGNNLSWVTRTLLEDDIRAGAVPTVLPGTGVRVLIGPHPAFVVFVSPTQINFLIPGNLAAGEFNVQVARDGQAGPPVKVALRDSAPALFHQEGWAVAARVDGSLVKSDAPAAPSDIVILVATGLGPLVPEPLPGHLPAAAARLARLAEFRLIVGQTQARVLYAGAAPGFPGLYQINAVLPDDAPADPEIRLELGERSSFPGVRLSLRPN